MLRPGSKCVCVFHLLQTSRLTLQHRCGRVQASYTTLGSRGGGSRAGLPRWGAVVNQGTAARTRQLQRLVLLLARLALNERCSHHSTPKMYQLVPAGDSSGTIMLQPGLTFLGRDNLGELGDKVLVTIHRLHAQVLLEDSSVRLTSLGLNPTGVRCRGTEWRWLAKGEAEMLADGMELAFSKSKQLRTQSTFVLRHKPTVRPEATSKSDPSDQPERSVKADPAPVKKRPPAGETQEPERKRSKEIPRHADVIELSDGEDELIPNEAQIGADAELARQLEAEQMASDEHRYATARPVAAPAGERRRVAPLQSRTILDRIQHGWISWEGLSVEPLSDWLEVVRPSLVPAHSCAWVAVDNQERTSPGFGEQRWNGRFDGDAYLTALAKIEDIIDSGKKVPKAAKQECVGSLLETAKQQGLTCGKWMVHVMPGVADAVWADVARATAEGKLGCSAKVAPTLGKPEAAYCGAYVHDFGNRAELKRVLVAFQELMKKHDVKVTAGFKPDVFTHLGITKKKPQQQQQQKELEQQQKELEATPCWRARQRLAATPTVYSVNEVLHEWDV